MGGRAGRGKDGVEGQTSTAPSASMVVPSEVVVARVKSVLPRSLEVSSYLTLPESPASETSLTKSLFSLRSYSAEICAGNRQVKNSSEANGATQVRRARVRLVLEGAACRRVAPQHLERLAP